MKMGQWGWGIFLLFLLSCVLPPQGLNTTTTTEQNHSAPQNTSPKSNISWIPQDVYYQKNALPRSDNFKIQDYPQDCGGNICAVTSLSASMNWPSIGGNTSASISLSNANNYVYGFKVLQWGKKDNGERIATLVQMGMSAYAGHEKPEPPYLRREIGSLYMYFTSTNGVNYVPTHSYAGNIVGSFSIFSVENISSVDPAICQLVQGSGSGPIKINPSLTLDPQGQKATVGFSLSASNVLNSGMKWRIVDQNEDPPVYGCLNTGVIGGASGSMSMTVRIPFIKEVVDTISVSADPATIDPRGNAPSKIKVTPSNPSRNWTLKAKAKRLYDDCSFTAKDIASGQGTKIDIPFGGAVPDGEYELLAEYDDANTPKEPGKTTVTASSEVAFNPTHYVVTLGTQATFALKQPICPKGKLTLVSGTLRSTVPGSEDVACQTEDFGTPGSTFSWNGVCQGPNGSVSGVGSADFKLEAAGKTALASVTIQAPSTGPTARPKPTPTPISKPTAKPDCPPGTECPSPTPPEPTDRPCPEGAICTLCPLAGCKGTPQPTHPTPLPEPVCPPDGICAPPEPEPECPAGAVCPEPGTPTPCPAGAICAPPPEPEPDENGTCPDGYIADQGRCIYCPPKYFGYQSGVGCYVEMGFGVEHVSINESAPSSPVTFSPRDINQLFDKVRFNTTANTQNFPGANFVKWDIKLKSQKGNWDDGDVFVNYLGLASILYDGWNEKQTCLIDGKYTARFLPKPLVGAGADPPQVLVQVPDYPHGVPVKIFMINQIGVNKDTVPFHVDNTPPVVKNLTIQEELVNAQEESYRTNISFTLIDPVVNESGATLSEAEIINGKNQLKDNALKIFVDDAPFYTSPAVDLDGFWIASAREKRPQELDDWSLEKPTDRSANVRFSLPYRLPGHTLEVEVNDTLANTGRYILYPQGGN
ncbi:MAG: hypothetical protein AB7I41_01895 [Candidatus Sericytochromatia bacterium]